jgi:FkbM family methyltransferase
MHRIAHRAAELIGRDSRFVSSLRRAYESIEGWSTHCEGVPFRINGVEFRRDPHCRDRFPDDFVYEPKVAAFLRERIKPGKICLDVGANVGYYALQLAHWSAPGGRVVAFEPNPGPRAILERIVKVNRLASRVTVIPSAVAAVSGRAMFYSPSNGRRRLDGISRLGGPAREFGADSSSAEVPVTTLDDYGAVSGSIPDWILIDIEGFELAALIGAKKTIAEYRGRLELVVEMHPDLWPDFPGSASAADLLDQLHLRPVPLTGQKDPLGQRGVVYLAAS